MKRINGFSLVELVVTLLILGIALAMAGLSFTDTIRRSRLVGAVEALHSDLQYAKSEALKQNLPVSISFKITSANDWCYGINNAGTSCDCTVTNPSSASVCAVIRDSASGDMVTQRNVLSTEYSGVNLEKTGAATEVTFSPTDSSVTGNTTITMTNQSNQELSVAVSSLGRVRLCQRASATDKLSGYEEC